MHLLFFMKAGLMLHIEIINTHLPPKTILNINMSLFIDFLIKCIDFFNQRAWTEASTMQFTQSAVTLKNTFLNCCVILV